MASKPGLQVYNFNVPTFGKGVVYDVDQKVRTEQFRFFTEALKKDRLKKYVPMFAAEADVSELWCRVNSLNDSTVPSSGDSCKLLSIFADTAAEHSSDCC